jgi:hypothetical protein
VPRKGNIRNHLDVQAVFRSNTWEPTVRPTGHLSIPAPAAPQVSAPSSVDLDVAADQAITAGGGDARRAVKRLIAAQKHSSDGLEVRQPVVPQVTAGSSMATNSTKHLMSGELCRFGGVMTLMHESPIRHSGKTRMSSPILSNDSMT